jgi:sigma-B regulation protein RsbU (phosphoserine phosphatase)
MTERSHNPDGGAEPVDDPADGAVLSSMQFLAESARDLNSTLELKEVFQKISQRVHLLIDFHLFCVGLWNEQTQLLEHSYSLRFGEHIEQRGGFPIGYGISGTAAQLRRAIRVPNVLVDPRYVRYRHADVEVHSELAVPLVSKDRLIGTLDLESVEFDAFTEEHEQMLSALAWHIATALDNARLYETVRANEQRFAYELGMAREIQRGLLPQVIPEVAGLEIGAAYAPAKELSGDFYDFLPYGRDRLALAVADVAGKSTAAALYGSLTVGIMRANALDNRYGPAEMLQHLNAELQLRSIEGRFVTMIFGIYDPTRRTLTLANSGLPYPFLVRGNRVETIEIRGLPLGLPVEPDRYDEVVLPLRPGDTVVLCSDGLEDCQDTDGRGFGRDRVESVLMETRHRSAREIADGLIRATDRHANNQQASDDRTVVVVKVAEA